MHRNIYILTFILIANLSAQQRGKIMGTITDHGTGEGLAGVNILIVGTQFGAATDSNGDYFIVNLPAGTYSLRVMMIGYAVINVPDISVKPGLSTHLDFQMTVEALEGEEVTIIAIKPLIQEDITYSSRYINANQIESLPVEDYTGILAMIPGFTRDAKGFHLRGGRAGEVKFKVDGVELQEPNYGTAYSGTSVLALNNRSLSEVAIQSGGFNAEFGNALSGVVEIATKAGHADHYEFSLDIESELPMDKGRLIPDENLIRKRSDIYFIYGDEYYNKKTQYDYTTGYKRYRLGLSGPIPLADRVTFNTSIQFIGSENGYLNRENTKDDLKELILNGKMRWQLFGSSSLTFSGSLTERGYDLFDVRRKFIPKTFQHRKSRVEQVSMIYNQSLNSRLFHSITLGYGRTYYRAAQPGKWWNITKDEEWNILSGENDVENPEAVNIGFVYKDSSLFIVEGDNNLFREEELRNYLGKWNLTYQIDRHNELKGGIEINYWDLFYQAVLAYKGFPFTFAYGMGRDDLRLPSIQPKLYSIFIQDKLEFSQLIMNVGVRYEIFDPDAELPSDFYRPYLDPGNIGPDPSDTDLWLGINNDIPTPNPEAPWKKASIKRFISPRLGVSHPITENSLFHFTYGHFYQIPDWYLLYRNYNYSYDILALYGNPDLEPEKTISYEVGVKQVVFESYVFDVTAFYKDISNLVETTVVNSLSDPAFIEIAEKDETVIRLPTWYINENIAWGSTKGFEISLVKLPSPNGGFSMLLSYTFMIAKGKTSDYHDGFLRQFSRGQLDPVQQFYLNWDQRHTISANADYRFKDGSGMTITYSFGSGYPYTGYQESLLPEENNKRLPATTNFDLKINKVASIGRTRINIYLFVTNVFDNVNVVNFDNGENRRIPVINHMLLYPEEYQGPLDDPIVFGPHREIRVGVNIDL